MQVCSQIELLTFDLYFFFSANVGRFCLYIQYPIKKIVFFFWAIFQQRCRPSKLVPFVRLRMCYSLICCFGITESVNISKSRATGQWSIPMTVNKTASKQIFLSVFCGCVPRCVGNTKTSVNEYFQVAFTWSGGQNASRQKNKRGIICLYY